MLYLKHPKIYLDSTGAHTDALWIENGRCLATGAKAKALVKESDGATHLDLTGQGECVFPGLMDAHLHLWDLGQREGLMDLKGAKSLEQMLQGLRARQGQPAASGWVEGHGWDQHGWSDWGTRSMERLDALFPDVPVCLHRLDYHAAMVNSEALRRAGLRADAPAQVEGGLVEVDQEGKMTGVLIDAAVELVTRAIPEPSAQEHLQVFEKNARLLHTWGVSCGHMAWMRAKDLTWLKAQESLPLRVYCMIEAKDAAQVTPHHDEHAWLSHRCIKYFADGAMGSKGALMHEPYRGGEGVGLAVISAEQLTQEIPVLMSQGWQVAVHAIGDKGATHVLDAFSKGSHDDRLAVRPRLEHAQIMRDQDIARMGQLGVMASIQPIHLWSDAPWAHKVLREHQMERLYNWRALQDVTTMAGGSDFPIDDLNPWHGIATAISRVDRDGQAFRPTQALARQEALAMYLSGAAYAAHWERDLGSLHPGFCADFALLGADPFECSVEELWGMQVGGLWIGGKSQNV